MCSYFTPPTRFLRPADGSGDSPAVQEAFPCPFFIPRAAFSACASVRPCRERPFPACRGRVPPSPAVCCRLPPSCVTPCSGGVSLPVKGTANEADDGPFRSFPSRILSRRSSSFPFSFRAAFRPLKRIAALEHPLFPRAASRRAPEPPWAARRSRMDDHPRSRFVRAASACSRASSHAFVRETVPATFHRRGRLRLLALRRLKL